MFFTQHVSYFNSILSKSLKEVNIQSFCFVGCSNGYCVAGSCSTTPSGPVCHCPPYYSGQRCERRGNLYLLLDRITFY